MRWLKLCLLDLWATLWSKFPEPENYPPEILELNEWSRSLRPSDKVDYDVLKHRASLSTLQTLGIAWSCVWDRWVSR